MDGFAQNGEEGGVVAQLYSADRRSSAVLNTQVNSRWASDDRLKQTRSLQKFRKLHLRGIDNPGLVYNLNECLSSHAINIESLDTYTQEAPSGSGDIFTMDGVTTMPVGLSIATFIHNLDTLQATLGAEISISDLPYPAQKFPPSSPQESS